MPRFALTMTPYEYEVSPGRRVILTRPELVAVVGAPAAVRATCFVDTGAPLSVVSCSVARQLGYTRVPVTNDPIPRVALGRAAPPARAAELGTWYGVPCELGELDVTLRNTRTGEASQPLRLLAKFLLAPTAFCGDRFVMLGMAFLADNGASLRIDGQPWGAAGHLDVP